MIRGWRAKSRNIWRRKSLGQRGGHCFLTTEPSRSHGKIFANSVDSACVILQNNNTHLVAEDIELDVSQRSPCASQWTATSDHSAAGRGGNVALRTEPLFMKSHEEEAMA